jgi:hypothetical protein
MSFRGNLHCHSNRSDGTVSPEEVARAYREAGYDFILLSDHFEAEYGWRITDTRDLRTPDFTTLLGAELSTGPWDDRLTYWVTAAGLPLDFEPGADPHEAGAFVTLLHPGLNNLPLEAVDGTAIDAVEIYNHNTGASHPDRAEGAYMADGLLERGHRLLLTAADDAHFHHDGDRFGAWVEVHAEALDPEALLGALKAGNYYSTQGPRIERLELDGDRLDVATSEVASIAIGGGGDRWQAATEQRGSPITEATFDVTAFRGSYCRVTAVDGARRRAWSNPIWPSRGM